MLKIEKETFKHSFVVWFGAGFFASESRTSLFWHSIIAPKEFGVQLLHSPPFSLQMCVFGLFLNDLPLPAPTSNDLVRRGAQRCRGEPLCSQNRNHCPCPPWPHRCT